MNKTLDTHRELERETRTSSSTSTGDGVTNDER